MSVYVLGDLVGYAPWPNEVLERLQADGIPAARQTCPRSSRARRTRSTGALDDPAEVEGTDAQRLEAFRRTAMELTIRLRPFIEIARRTAGREVRPVVAG